jgi:hypothetical protein
MNGFFVKNLKPLAIENIFIDTFVIKYSLALGLMVSL